MQSTVTSVFFVALGGLLFAAEPSILEQQDLFTAGKGGYESLPGFGSPGKFVHFAAVSIRTT